MLFAHLEHQNLESSLCPVAVLHTACNVIQIVPHSGERGGGGEAAAANCHWEYQIAQWQILVLTHFSLDSHYPPRHPWNFARHEAAARKLGIACGRSNLFEAAVDLKFLQVALQNHRLSGI